ncbi:MAG: hypothetical protein WBG73_08945 [Coleofasciculaceae cyanobacterium]
MIREFTGGDPEIAKSLNKMYQEEGAEVVTHGAVDTAMNKAIVHLKQS